MSKIIVPPPKKVITPNEFDSLLRLDLSAFTHRAFTQLNPGTPFLPNWHIDMIAGKLRDCMLGKTRRLVINIPPRHTKSITASVAFPAWLLGHDPSAQIVAVSYSQELANKHSLDCRAVMESDWFRRLFPETRLSPTRNAVQEFTTTKRGFRLATSVGGTLTGRGGDFIIIDDPLKPEDADSDAARRRANDWFDGTLYSRQNDPNKSRIVAIMHRLHEDDLIGQILEQEAWDVLSLPAIAESEEKIEVDSPYGLLSHHRKEGDLLQPERMSREALAAVRATIGEYHFAGQYQQTPSPKGGGLVKAEWFKHYAADALPVKFDQIISSWDTANKATELSDYSVCTTFGVRDDQIYLLDVFREKLRWPDLKREVKARAAQFSADIILIEDKGSGIQLLEELRGEGVPGVKAYLPKCEKVARLQAQCSAIENGRVHLPEAAPWRAAYIHEMITFPAAKHDDQVDATSQALEFIAIGQRNLGLLLFYKRDHEQRMARMRGETV